MADEVSECCDKWLRFRCKWVMMLRRVLVQMAGEVLAGEMADEVPEGSGAESSGFL